jgi:N-acetylmuramate 1-kinase
MDRQNRKQHFLEEYIQTWYNLEPMNADASFRSYQRIKTPCTTYVLMDCPPEHYSTKPFEVMSEWLTSNNLSAPRIFHKDTDNGFLLLEDFGDILLKHILHNDLSVQYKRSMDLLLELHSLDAPNWLPQYTNEMFLKELEIFTDYYIPFVIGRSLVASKKEEYLLIWADALEMIPCLGNKIVLRDYHVENLMHLDDREGVKSLGILDFQDAAIGSPIYDIVSILEDARHEVEFGFAKEMYDYYLSKAVDILPKDAYLAYDILGAQRNIRILGVFARKKLRDKNDNYLQYIPRLLRYLERDLQNPYLKSVRIWHHQMLGNN